MSTDTDVHMTDIVSSAIPDSTATKPSSTKPSSAPPSADAPTKPNPYTYTLPHLSITDPNPLPPTRQLLTQPRALTETTLRTVARDGAQSLINTLLTTCPITSTPDGPSINLTSSSAPNQHPHPFPRRLPLPKPKEPTKWQAFASRKGIGKYSATGGAREQERRKNLTYDEESGEWVKRWGHRGANKKKDGDEWLVELDDAQVAKEKGLDGGKSIRREGRRERVEKIRRQDRRERANAVRSGKGRGGGGGGGGGL